MMENGTLAAVDPGREKCGIAVLDVHGVVLFQKVIETLNLAREINDKHSRYAFAVLVLGNGTTSKEAKERIEGSAGREAFWRAALSEHILNLVEESRLDEAEAEIRHALDCFGTES